MKLIFTLNERKYDMLLTSAEANKLLKKLKDEHNETILKERRTSVFTASLGEDPETLRPEYDFSMTDGKLKELEEKIRVLKHSINVFNTVTEVPGIGMTIDEVLVYIPQLTADRDRLYSMQSRLPKERVQPAYHSSSPIVDYSYTNYDPAEAEREYTKVCDRLSEVQLALDAVNTSVRFEIPDIF